MEAVLSYGSDRAPGPEVLPTLSLFLLLDSTPLHWYTGDVSYPESLHQLCMAEVGQYRPFVRKDPFYCYMVILLRFRVVEVWLLFNCWFGLGVGF